jgi:molybdopterin converting factor small subunit
MHDLTDFIRELETEKANILTQAEQLKADDRLDESNMEKVRANVYDIAVTLARTAQKSNQGDVLVFLREKLSGISDVWREALQEAKRRGDYVREAVERIKVSAVDKILNQLKGEMK